MLETLKEMDSNKFITKQLELIKLEKDSEINESK